MPPRAVRLIVLAVAAVVAGTAAAAYSGSSAREPPRTANRLRPHPKPAAKPQPTLQRFSRATAKIRVYPKRLRDLCRREAASGAAFAARRPPTGSSVADYIAWLDEAARRAASLDARLRALPPPLGLEPQWRRLLQLTRRRAQLWRELVQAVERRDVAAYKKAVAAFDGNARAAVAPARALRASGCA